MVRDERLNVVMDCGAPTARRHIILVKHVGHCMENLLAVSGDKRVIGCRVMDKLMLQPTPSRRN